MPAIKTLVSTCHDLATEIVAVGVEIGLPHVAVSADISCPDPMLDANGIPFAESMFTWVVPNVRYWEDRSFALRSSFCRTIRAFAEPFFVRDGIAASWRPSPTLDVINKSGPVDSPGVRCAIVAPTYLTRGVMGAVVWASPDPSLEIDSIFNTNAARLHALALRFIGSYHEANLRINEGPAARLTRREVQCLKWAAAGKTDADIGEIVHIAVPTVRFHLTNAWRKLRVVGRSQAVHRASELGYISPVARLGPRTTGSGN